MRGYRQIDIKGEGGEKPSPQTLKLFWDGLVNDITWTFTWHKSDSDSRESHSITNTLAISTSGYYADCMFYTPQIDLTNYSKIKFTVNSGWSQTADGRKVGVMINNALNSYTRQQTGVGGANTYTLDISSLRGFYFVSIYTSSQNRNGSGITVSRVWLEQ